MPPWALRALLVVLICHVPLASWADDRVAAFYQARGFTPAWLSDEGREAADALITRIEDAAADGLSAAHYAPADLRERLRMGVATPTAAFTHDIALTTAFLSFATDLAFGRGGQMRPLRRHDIVSQLAGVHDAPSAHEALARLVPQHTAYDALRRALAVYRGVADRGGWTSMPPVLLRPADGREPAAAPATDDPQVRQALNSLCRRLAMTGDLVLTAPERDCPAWRQYDHAIQAAVERFQTRHGLTVDGIVGRRTRAALNVSAADRVHQLTINMNRWRQLPDDFGARHVDVNIPAFRLDAYDRGQRVLSMPVVTGRPSSPTPMMADTISYLVFRPYWNVPASITFAELLPQATADPDFLRRQRFQIVDGWTTPAMVVDPASLDWTAPLEDFPYRLRQLPGAHNALGLVKFMFPNEHNVYLHDTPAKHLFSVPRRALSHGCVRVADPLALAEFALAGHPGWSRDAIASAMHRGRRQATPLEQPLPVYLTYRTAWVDESVVHFRADIYGWDDDHGATADTSESSR